MAWNGSGEFNLVYNWPQDAANGIKILATRMQAQEEDIATGLENCLTLDGQTTPTANIPMGGFKFTGAADGSAATDFVTLGQLQTPGSLALFATGLTISTNGITVSAGGINVTGTTVLAGAASVGAGLSVAGGISVTSSGIVVASGGITVQAGGASITGNAAIAGQLSTTNTITVQAGDVNVSTGTIAVSGATSQPSLSGFTMSGSGTGAFGPAAVTYGIIATTAVVSTAFYATSDVRLKTLIEDISVARALEWVRKSRPVTYMKRSSFLADDGVYEAGFIAQEQVRAGFGRHVGYIPSNAMPKTDDGPADNALTLSPQYQIAFLTAALKNALARIETLEGRLS